jgi:xylulokinase
VRHNLEAFRDAGGPSPRLVAVGGGTRGGLWTQIVSDVTGEEQQVPADTTGAALGDALLAAQALGLDADAATWNPIVDVVRPDPERTARYDAFHAHYRALYPATADAAHFLAEQQRHAGA